MDEAMVRKLIQLGESLTTEFKDSFDQDARETVGAFSNTHGGYILVGVSNDRTIKGVQLGRESIVRMIDDVANNTQPRIVPMIEPLSIDGRDIAVVTVRESGIKPIAVRGKCFKRDDASNRLMSPQEIAEMYSSCIGMSADVSLLHNCAIDDIDLEKVKKYIRTSLIVGRKKFDNDDPIYVLEKLGLVKDRIPTLASIVLFGKSTIDKLPYVKVHCGRFKDGSTIVDDKYVVGTTIEQVDEVLSFILKNIGVKYEISGKPGRTEVWDYPPIALREAVVNAICHRDYTSTSEITVKIYDDKLVIWNPGGLPAGLTINDLYDPHHPSRPRNRLIADIFYDVMLVEKYGSGIPRIIDACKKSGIPVPAFEEKYGGFSVTFRKNLLTEEFFIVHKLNERQAKALIYMKEHGKITNLEYQSINGVSKNLATTELKELMTKGIINRIGTTGKGTHYVFPDKEIS
ncbi:MAG: Divergent AAA domain protein [Methanocella sp. PtaU1.Bin125]|nr:MAG: Divergent AAA domain protein [Methanocella sp. PtaU1.Bin125]